MRYVPLQLLKPHFLGPETCQRRLLLPWASRPVLLGGGQGSAPLGAAALPPACQGVGNTARRPRAARLPCGVSSAAPALTASIGCFPLPSPSQAGWEVSSVPGSSWKQGGFAVARLVPFLTPSSCWGAPCSSGPLAGRCRCSACFCWQRGAGSARAGCSSDRPDWQIGSKPAPSTRSGAGWRRECCTACVFPRSFSQRPVPGAVAEEGGELCPAPLVLRAVGQGEGKPPARFYFRLCLGVPL